jgi:hypothetical protein
MHEDFLHRPAQDGSDSAPDSSAPSAPKARWERPRLVDHGDVRELTLGTTQGLPESGAPGTLRA